MQLQGFEKYNINTKEYIKVLQKIYKKTMKEENQKPNIVDVSVVAVNGPEIKKYNEKTRGVKQETDVLSFPNIEDIEGKAINKSNFPVEYNPRTKKVLLGEILINIDKVKTQSKEFQHSFKRELSYLFLHSLLHLFGYDHKDDQSKRIMRDKEKKILKKAKVKRI
ncbi:MAG: rRNA maturation RNase YbeY [Candidatus Woesearchaeota archaeon]